MRRRARERMVMTEWESLFPGGQGATLIMYHTIQIFITVCPKTRRTDRERVCARGVHVFLCVVVFPCVGGCYSQIFRAARWRKKGARMRHICCCAFHFVMRVLFLIIIIFSAAAAVKRLYPVFFSRYFFFLLLFDVPPRDTKERKKACNDSVWRHVRSRPRLVTQLLFAHCSAAICGRTWCP